MNKLIKNIDRESWNEIKFEAFRSKMKIGEFLDFLLREHKKITENKKSPIWDYIKYGKKSLTCKNAEEIKKYIDETYDKEFDFEWH